MLHSVQTPPTHSWKNPCERVMSFLNIRLQSVGMMRQETENYEHVLIYKVLVWWDKRLRITNMFWNTKRWYDEKRDWELRTCSDLQSVGMMRQETENYEHVLKSANSLAAIRKLAKDDPAIKDDVTNCVQLTTKLLETIFSQLTHEEKDFQVFKAAVSRCFKEIN